MTTDRMVPVILRRTRLDDAAVCGRVLYEGFTELGRRHGFPPDFASPGGAVIAATSMVASPAIYGVVAELAGDVVGCIFVDEKDVVRSIGPMAVVPHAQRRGIASELLSAAMRRVEGSVSMRGVSDGFNMHTAALYALLGFDVKEPVIQLAGSMRDEIPVGFEVRRLRPDDLDACADLCTRVHGFARTNELKDALGVPVCAAFVAVSYTHLTLPTILRV